MPPTRQSSTWQSEETLAPKLPPFGINNLDCPSELPGLLGLLHISVPQYDSTIKSYPDAALTYHDDDDGEEITVGSGIELEQRLAEPIRHGKRVSIQSILQLQRDCDQRIHLFDIKNSADSRAVWNEHAAYSSKSLREYYNSSSEERSWEEIASEESSPEPSRPVTKKWAPLPPVPSFNFAKQFASVPPVPSLNLGSRPRPITSMKDFDASMAAGEAAAAAASQEAIKALEQAESQPQIPQVSSTSTLDRPASDPLREFVEMHIGTFADFLDSAAGVLQSVAQKTRDADTTPVESMLCGMKEILSEVGQLGMEVLNGLEHERIPEQIQGDPAPQQNVVSGPVEFGEAEPVSQPPAQSTPVAPEVPKRIPTLSKRVSFAHDETKESANFLDFFEPYKSEEPLDKLEGQHWAQKSRDDEMKRREYEKILSSRYLASRTTPFGHVDHPYRSFPNRPGPQSSSQHTQPPLPAPASIMDIETSNAEFAARYPPLMSLRRAKTVSDLHTSKQDGPEPMNTRGALHRYPSIGQLEAQRKKPYDIHHKKRGMPPLDTARKEPRNNRYAPSLVSPISPISAERPSTSKALTSGYKSPTVEDELTEKTNKFLTQPLVKQRKGVDYENVPTPMPRTLPGSWPEPKSEEMIGLPIPTESSGAFFNRMTGNKQPEVVPKRAVSPALSCRNTGPPEDPFWPSGGLRRAHTVTASNPAARLTRPFDPMCGAPNPLFPRSNRQSGTLSEHVQPRRSQTHRESTRPQHPSHQSTIGRPTNWSAMQQPTQAPMVNSPNPNSIPDRLPARFSPSLSPSDVPTTFGIPVWEDMLRPLRPLSFPEPINTVLNVMPPEPNAFLKVEDCVKSLKQMGYGADRNEAARLKMYASAAAGDVVEAMDMIEEDRQVVAAMNEFKGGIRTL